MPKKISRDELIARAKGLEKQLENSREHIRSLMESTANFGLYRLKSDINNPFKVEVVLVSPSVKDILGVPEPMKYEAWIDYVHPEDVGRLAEANRMAFETMRFDEEFRFFNPKQHKYRWIRAISTGCTDNGVWNGYINGIMIDVTREHGIKDELLKSQEHLKNSLKALKRQSKKMKDLNVALNVLLKKRDREKLELEQSIALNIKEIIMPFIGRLQKTKLEESQRSLLDLIESHLKEIGSTFAMKLSMEHSALSPSEFKVASLIRQGMSSKEIAELMNLSPKTIKNQRASIRGKLGLIGSKVNLTSYLKSI